MTEQQLKIIDWQRALLNEAAALGYRIAKTEPIPDIFYTDLALSLESLAERVRREMRSSKREA